MRKAVRMSASTGAVEEGISSASNQKRMQTEAVIFVLGFRYMTVLRIHLFYVWRVQRGKVVSYRRALDVEVLNKPIKCGAAHGRT